MIDFFDFCVYNFFCKNYFCKEIKIKSHSSAKENLHFYIYKKQKKFVKRLYRYTKKDNFKKARQFAIRFYSQKAETLRQ